ncbi:hypothetical protein GCM10009759_55030 [Kitasatospora saccharophila]|uniref:Uncharacterized protein n=1 Tax=Kitasatospora saccharophila TaxID=407973 RepID=A0ABN2XJJ5_9ACTN
MSGQQAALAAFECASTAAILLGREVPLRTLTCGCYRVWVDLAGVDRVVEGEVVQHLLSAAPQLAGRASSSGKHRDLHADFHEPSCTGKSA